MMRACEYRWTSAALRTELCMSPASLSIIPPGGYALWAKQCQQLSSTHEQHTFATRKGDLDVIVTDKTSADSSVPAIASHTHRQTAGGLTRALPPMSTFGKKEWI
eukprot:2562024-Rhodomonas_salina.1